MLMKKEKRKLQERMRRQRKILEWQKILQERYLAGSTNGLIPGGNLKLVCGRCGMIGHMKARLSAVLKHW